MADQQREWDVNGKLIEPTPGAGGRGQGAGPVGAPSSGGRASGAGPGPAPAATSTVPPPGMEQDGWDHTGKPIFKKIVPKSSSGLTARQLIAKAGQPNAPSAYPGVDQATERQWASAGLNSSELLRNPADPQTGQFTTSPEQQAAQQQEWARAKETGKTGLNTLAMLAGGEAVAAGAAMTQAPRFLQGLMRIGGNAGVGAGVSFANREDPVVGATVGGGSQAVGEVLTALAPRVAQTALRVVAPIARKFGRNTDIGLRAIHTPGLHPETLAANAGADIGAARGAKGTLLRTIDDQPMSVAQVANRASGRVRPDVGADFEVGLSNAEATGQHAGPTISRFANRTGTRGVDFRTTRGPMVHDWNTDPATGRITNVPVMQTISFEPVPQPRMVTASRLDRLKSRLDTRADALHRAAQEGKLKLQPRAEEARALARESGAAIERRLGPEGAAQYRGHNREIMEATGLRLAAQGRADIPATGMQNLGLAFGPQPSMTRAAMRAALMPESLMAIAKGGYQAGQVFENPALRAAILNALMGQVDDPNKER